MKDKARQIFRKMPEPMQRKYHNVRSKYRYANVLLALKIQQWLNRKKDTDSCNRIENQIMITKPTQLQKRLDDLNYPPTHDYQLLPLKPRGVTKIRLEQFKLLDPEFFTGLNFLDIGCNKGFFSLTASKKCKWVTSIEKDQKYSDLVKMLAQQNMFVLNTGFRDFTSDKEFDRILIGNVAHYLFLETKGWDWIDKLACYATDKVIFEGAVDMNCKEMENVIPQKLRPEFNKFLQKMEKHFDIVEMIPSQTKQRFIILFKKKPEQKFRFKDLEMDNVVKNHSHSTVVFLKENQVAKLKNKSELKKNNIRIASMSPISNGMIGLIYSNKNFVGWMEKAEKSDIYKYKENPKLFNLICKHQAYLSRLGYIDCDCGSINFFKTDKLFDKGMVLPIKEIKDYYIDNYLQYLDASFDVDLTVKNKIRYAFKSKDSKVIESIFTEIML